VVVNLYSGVAEMIPPPPGGAPTKSRVSDHSFGAVRRHGSISGHTIYEAY
jgi:hypothetical protein